MRPRNCGDLVAEDGAAFLRRRRRRAIRAGARGSFVKGEIVDALGVKMNFAMIIAGEALEQFGESTLRTVAAVHERRDDGKTQVSASRKEKDNGIAKKLAASATLLARRRIARRRRGWAGGTRCPEAATDRRSARNPRRPAFRHKSWEGEEARHTKKS